MSVSDDGHTAVAADTSEFWSAESGRDAPQLVVTYAAG
jgi:hypothetical protein